MSRFMTGSYRWLPLAQLVTSLGIIAFWLYFFLVENSNPNNSIIYLSYERAFPVPDILGIVPLLLLSSFWLAQNNVKGIITTVAAGGGLVFLGLVDFSFNFTQGIYALSLGDAVINGIINSYCVIFGYLSIFLGWKLCQANSNLIFKQVD